MDTCFIWIVRIFEIKKILFLNSVKYGNNVLKVVVSIKVFILLQTYVSALRIKIQSLRGILNENIYKSYLNGVFY